MPLHMTRCLRCKALEAIFLVLGMEVVARLALVRVRVLLLIGAEEARDALLKFAKNVHLGVFFCWWC